jgi:fructose-bisphosphate aldolase, class II
MALISLRQLLDHAAEHQYGIAAFNVNNMEQIHAIMQAADELDSPVILQASAGARKYGSSCCRAIPPYSSMFAPGSRLFS